MKRHDEDADRHRDRWRRPIPLEVTYTIFMPALLLVFGHKVWSEGDVLVWRDGGPTIEPIALRTCEDHGGKWVGNVIAYPIGQQPRRFALYCKMHDGSLTRYEQVGRVIVSIETHADPAKDDQ